MPVSGWLAADSSACGASGGCAGVGGGVFIVTKRNMAEADSVRRRAIRMPRGPATICARRSVFLNKSKPGGKPIRIVAGQYRRTPIAVPDVPGLRPTPDRVRETLFNWVN